MKKLTKIFLLLGVLLSAAGAVNAQNMSDMRLNEILIENNEGNVDDYGNRSGWIELFNTSFGTVDVGGCFLTDDPDNLKKYMIPKGDVLTKVKPRQHILFFADNLPDRGTFHISFDLKNAKEILLVSSDGRTVIDRVSIPAGGIPADKSYGRVVDGEGSHTPIHFMKKSYNLSRKEAEQGPDGGWAVLEKVTPSTNNVIHANKTRALEMMETDPTGGIMAITAMSVVFMALLLLFVVFKNVGNYSIRKAADKAIKARGTSPASDTERSSKAGEPSAEVYAAIAMAFHCYKIDSEAHDYENTILTINKVSKTYSPWSSKIYTLRETPQLKK